jgi:3-oxoadipate enol-lactonase
MAWARPPGAAVIARMARDMTYRPEADGNFQLEATTFDGRVLVQDVRAPTLVLAGHEDLTYPVAQCRALADLLPHGRFVDVPGAGHFPFVEQNTRVVAEIVRFLGAR